MSEINSRMEPPGGVGSSFVRDPLVILRRLWLWTLLCSVSAAPSFLWAMSEYSRPAMLTGVVIFILLYTATTSTQAFHRFSRRPFVRRTLYIGYGLRVLCSLLFPLGMLIDLWPGLLSVFISELFFSGASSFVFTLVTTLLQGTFLNIILGMFMLILYALQRAVCKPPPQNEGFCEKCGYDLRASYEFGRCPECGTPCSKPAGRPAPSGTPVAAPPDP